METINTITDVVANFGFPIAMCGILLWYIYKKDNQHKQEVDKLAEALNNNTVVLEKLLVKLGGDN